MAKTKETPSLVLGKPEMPADPVAMRRAAAILKVAIPTGDNADALLLASLRKHIGKLIKDKNHILCMQCDERSTEDTPFCPFCGDDGEVEEQPQVVAEQPPAVAAEVVVAEEKKSAAAAPKEKTEKPKKATVTSITAAKDKEKTKPVVADKAELAVDVTEDVKAMDEELEGCVQRIKSLTDDTLRATYETGVLLKQINDKTLYRARGYNSFRKFVSESLPIAPQTAYQLVSLVEQYDQKTFEAVGYRKLKAIASLVGEAQSEVLDAARAGATAAEVEDMVRGKKTRPAIASGDPKKKDAAPTNATPAATATPKKVTLLTKVDDKPIEVKLVSLKTGQPLASAGKVSFVVADAYGDVELADGVHMRVGLRVVGKDIVGFTIQYARAVEAAE